MKLNIKKSRAKMVYVRISDEMHAAIKALAKKEKVEMNEVIRALLEAGFEATKGEAV